MHDSGCGCADAQGGGRVLRARPARPRTDVRLAARRCAHRARADRQHRHAVSAARAAPRQRLGVDLRPALGCRSSAQVLPTDGCRYRPARAVPAAVDAVRPDRLVPGGRGMTMMTDTSDYLARLDDALRDVPHGVAAEIRAGIAEELMSLSPDAAEARITQLGDPAVIAREAMDAGGYVPPAPSALGPAPMPVSRTRGFAIAAALALSFG